MCLAFFDRDIGSLRYMVNQSFRSVKWSNVALLQEATTCDVASTIDSCMKEHNISVPFFLQQQLLIYITLKHSMRKEFLDYRAESSKSYC